MSLAVKALPHELWEAAVKRLVSREMECDNDVERCIRHAFHLVQICPLEVRPLVGTSADEKGLEDLLSSAKFPLAINFLAAPEFRCICEKLQEASFVARVTSTRRNDLIGEGAGHREDAALLRAYTDCLLRCCHVVRYGTVRPHLHRVH